MPVFFYISSLIQCTMIWIVAVCSTITITSVLLCLERKEAAQYSPCVLSCRSRIRNLHTPELVVTKELRGIFYSPETGAFKGITAFMIRLIVIMDSVDLTPYFYSHEKTFSPAHSHIPLPNYVNRSRIQDLPAQTIGVGRWGVNKKVFLKADVPLSAFVLDPENDSLEQHQIPSGLF